MQLSFKIFLVALYIGFFLLVGPISGWFLFNATTWVGYGLAVLGILTLGLPLLFALSRRSPREQLYLRWALGLLCTAWLGIVGCIVLIAPSGDTAVASPVRHGFSGEARFNRYNLANLIPESEQINLGFTIMPYLDSILTVQQARDVAPITLEIYREMEQDEDFHQLGSVMGWAYAQLLGMPFNKGHYYLYIPENPGNMPLPALVFLHGSAGNFKAYTWILSKLAEARGMVIIAPSYGFGNWDQEGVEGVMRAIDDAAQDFELDADRIYLMGLSNGGLGVSQAAVQYPEKFRGLIFLSPVMAATLVDSPEFQDLWQNRPILVISGVEDRRIPVGYVQGRVSKMQSAGIAVSSRFFPVEDHFLFFSKRDEIVREISEWLTAR